MDKYIVNIIYTGCTKIKIYSMNEFPTHLLIEELKNNDFTTDFILTKSVKLSKFIKKFIKNLNTKDNIIFDLVFTNNLTYRYYC